MLLQAAKVKTAAVFEIAQNPIWSSVFQRPTSEDFSWKDVSF